MLLSIDLSGLSNFGKKPGGYFSAVWPQKSELKPWSTSSETAGTSFRMEQNAFW
ncbi:hypothetical protein SAMN04488524_3148 [Pedobacter africanus]|uniref:Uncharacterized protein n=1 Tax=Pedobacter africanus TaxID=151894 RepID=A0A1W2CR14_9SPHI|nr:hypothetical protein SAMN04488524_3148 [Pedobacter africanus]